MNYVPRNGPTNQRNKMKYLTPVYLTMMYAFTDRALERLDGPDWDYISPVGKMQEFGTLRIDGGRQTGKSTAVADFASRWRDAGNDVIVLSTNSSQSRELVDLIKRKCTTNHCLNRNHQGFIIGDTIRSFLSDDGFTKYRGLSITRLLIIIDEPMKVPDMSKFYNAYQDLVNRYMCQGNKPLPLFFVIGIQ
jgi:hypothetical protein